MDPGPAEAEIVRIAADGGWADLGVAGAGAQVRAAWLAEALTGSDGPFHPRGLRVRGARITGSLDLADAVVGVPMLFDGCRFDADIVLDRAKCQAVGLTSCALAGLSARRIDAAGPVEVARCRVALGSALDLSDATIAGGLRIAGTTVHKRGFWAVSADQIEVGHDLDLRGCRIIGGVSVKEATVMGSVLAGGARIERPLGDALVMTDTSVAHSVLLDDGFRAEGTVRLEAARVGGSLVLEDAELSRCGPDGALAASRLSVGGRLLLGRARSGAGGGSASRPLRAGGTVALAGARIGAGLVAEGVLIDASGDGLRAPGLVVTGNLALRGATITASDAGQEYPAAVKVSDGELGSLVCVGATLSCSRGFALMAQRLVVHASVFLTEGRRAGTGRGQFQAVGTIDLVGAMVDGEVSLQGAVLAHPRAQGLAFDGRYLRVRRALILSPGRLEGSCDLSSASVGRLVDDGAWCDGNVTLYLDGLVYGSLSSTKEVGVAERLRRLRSQPEVRPQPYTQLREAYLRAGDDTSARKVAMARERDLTADPQNLRQVVAWTWTRSLAILVGNGYAPWRAIWCLLFLLAGGTVVFSRAAHAGILVPSSRDPNAAEVTPAACRTGYACFEAVAFTVDVVVPVIDLDQRRTWRIDASRSWGPWARRVQWTLTGLGWLFTTAFVAAVTGVVKRE